MLSVFAILFFTFILVAIYGFKARRDVLDEWLGKSLLRCYLGLFLLILTGVLFAELTLFNFRYYESVLNSEIKVADYRSGDGLWRMPDGRLQLLAKGDKSIEIADIGAVIDNLHLDVRSSVSKSVSVTLFASDEGNRLFYQLPTREVLAKVRPSQFLRLHLYGKARALKIAFNMPAGDVIEIKALSLNSKWPFFFSFERILFLQGALMLLALVWPSSRLYRQPYNPVSPLQKGAIALYIVLQILFFWGVVKLNPMFVNPPWPHHQQYHQLTESIAEGKAYLKEKPSDAMVVLDNPYDPGQRQQEDVNFPFDHAYFEGKYYVYFGIGPVALFYLPYYALTGSHLPTYIGVFLVSVGAIFAIVALLGEIVRRWFLGTPFVLYLLLTALFVNGAGFLYMVKRPDFYNFPIILGVTLAIAGLYFWFSSTKKDDPILRSGRLLLGSICMALVAACRPQLLFTSFFAVIIFWDAVFKHRTLFSKRGIRATERFLFPFVVVAAVLMYYNHVRFGSIFEFGNQYCLTINDLTRRGLVFDRTFLGLFAYLFQPTNFQVGFPFIKPTHLDTGYLGITIQENPIGGVIYNNMLLLLALLVFKFRRVIGDRTAYGIAVSSTFFALIILIMDTQLAGILMRYISDFSWLLYLSATIVAFAITRAVADSPLRPYWFGFVVIAFFAAMSYQLLGIFTDSGEPLLSFANPVVTRTIAHLVQFWL